MSVKSVHAHGGCRRLAGGTLPEVGTVRVVAWFPDNPSWKFVSRWRFEGSNVSVAVSNTGAGTCRATGSRSGNTTRTTGTCAGCVNHESAVFHEDGRTTFSGLYCGETRASGVGRWSIVSVEKGAAK